VRIWECHIYSWLRLGGTVELEAFIEFSEALWRKRNNMGFVLNGICGWNFTAV
jgi:hypothetical protein